ncbi:hypothetical protein FGO68_gene339 [Halteria grandinella]|uniref:RING-type domain-containing protein n=1 Tax=Halteria grandinella TaxID=5974 RepID=A0A8J8NFF8_HALGN|nr:hypothetical protein FGO68_gene339 [Halteria grandinella]
MSGMAEEGPRMMRVGERGSGIMQELDFQHIGRQFQMMEGRLGDIHEPQFYVIQVGENGGQAVQQIFQEQFVQSPMRMGREQPGILAFQDPRSADWEVQRYAARVLRQREAAEAAAAGLNQINRGSTSEEHRPDIDFQRQQLVLWGLPFLQFLIRGAGGPFQEIDGTVKAQNILEQLTTLGTFQQPEETKEESESQTPDPCSICFEEFKDGNMLREINHCKHMFHQKCIEEWIRRKCQSGVASCPLCKHELIALPDGDQ